MRSGQQSLRLRLWADADLGLLRATNTPQMTEHLGGPESERQLLARHHRYLEGTADGTFQMFVIETELEAGIESGGETFRAVGSIGYWPTRWYGEDVYETGWSVLAAHQGRGLATAAARLVTRHAREHGDRDALHAFPAVGNPASNAICAKAGFRLLGQSDFEYPPGQRLRVNDWWLDLTRIGSAPPD
jgi:RimJ/RimL family protein N-acetyltransferase